MAEMALVQLNTLESTSAQIEAIRVDLELKRQSALKKWRELYPNARISDLFLLDSRRAEQDELTCTKCKSAPCAKKNNPGFKHCVREEKGALYVFYRECEKVSAERRLKLAKIPQMYAGKTLADYKVDANNKNAVGWARQAESLYLFGAPGVGKTFLAAIIAQEQILKGKSVIFGDVPSLLDRLKGTFDSGAESTIEELMARLSAVDVLVLDDLGTEMPTEWAVERLYLIVNSRYTKGKQIIVTSNYAPEVAAARLNKPKNAAEGVTGSRIMSRLRQMCKVAQIGGSDRRLGR